jgi:hypothetical protein
MTIITIAKTIIAAATTTTTAPKASAEERKRIATGREARRGGRGALGLAIIIASTPSWFCTATIVEPRRDLDGEGAQSRGTVDDAATRRRAKPWTDLCGTPATAVSLHSHPPPAFVHRTFRSGRRDRTERVDPRCPIIRAGKLARPSAISDHAKGTMLVQTIRAPARRYAQQAATREAKNIRRDSIGQAWADALKNSMGRSGLRKRGE